jgi:Xaa-Pro aminopeptidase
MLTSRLSHVKKLLKKINVDAALISSLSNIVYLTNFYHFSDMEREAFLLITPKTNYIFTDARYSHAVKTSLKNYTLLEISINSSFSKLLEEVLNKEKIKTLGIEENNITVTEYKKILSLIKSINNINLRSLRIKKDKQEIEKIKTA